jgi:AcrR family transcriptional regulator
MPRTRHEGQHQATSQAIKDAARRLMAEHGTAGISIRGIAKEIGLTPPAIYTYFPRLEDLITALIVDGFNAQAAAMAEARDSASGGGPVAQLEAALMAYRGWALAHPVDFQLIYGNPIPGYVAPPEITVPAAVQGFKVVIDAIETVIRAGRLAPTLLYTHIPAYLAAHLRHMRTQSDYAASEMAIYLAVVGWSQLHGLVMLELFHHLQPVVGDTDQHFRAQVSNMLHMMGLTP